jgi:hypothetical protein
VQAHDGVPDIRDSQYILERRSEKVAAIKRRKAIILGGLT